MSQSTASAHPPRSRSTSAGAALAFGGGEFASSLYFHVTGNKFRHADLVQIIFDWETLTLSAAVALCVIGGFLWSRRAGKTRLRALGSSLVLIFCGFLAFGVRMFAIFFAAHYDLTHEFSIVEAEVLPNCVWVLLSIAPAIFYLRLEIKARKRIGILNEGKGR